MQPTTDNQPPKVAGIRAGPALTAVLYLLLAGSAALALWVRGYPGQAPVDVERAAPWAFLAFVAAFAVYRGALVRAGRYPAFKAFFQIIAGVIFFTLLLPGNWPPRPPSQTGEVSEPLPALLHDANVRVRRLAAEVARQRPLSRDDAKALAAALTDADPTVRLQAHRTLVQITSEDLGSPDDPQAVRAWKERYQ